MIRIDAKLRLKLYSTEVHRVGIIAEAFSICQPETQLDLTGVTPTPVNLRFTDLCLDLNKMMLV